MRGRRKVFANYSLICLSILVCLNSVGYVPTALAQGSAASNSAGNNNSRTATATVTLKGRVLVEATGAPLAGSLISAPLLHRTTQTDRNGLFEITGINSGTVQLEIRRIGYIPVSIAVDTDSLAGNQLIVRMRPTAIELSSITVTTDKEQPVGRTFQPASALEGVKLDNSLTTNIAATISTEPGVVQKYNGPVSSQPVIRGLTGDRVTVLEDGLRTGDIASTSSDHAITIDPLSAKKVEVIRGPAGLLYGTNTLGGVVNVIREDIPHSRVERNSFWFGSQLEAVNSSRSVHGGTSIPLPYRLNFTANAASRKAGDTRTPIGRLPNTNLTSMDASTGVSFIGDQGLLGVSVRRFSSEYGVPSSINGTLLPGSHEDGVYVNATRIASRIEGEYRPVEPVGGLFNSFRFQSSYVRFEQKEFEDAGVVGTHFGQLSGSGDFVAKYSSGRNSGAVGVFAQWRDFRAAGGFTGTRPARQKAGAVFGFHEIQIADLSLLGGLRIDGVSYTPLDSTPTPLLPVVASRSFGAATWTLGATYPLTPELSIGANVAKAFRAPAIEELYSSGPHLANYAYEVGNPNIGAEIGIGGDFFIRYISSRAAGELSLFSNDIRNFIGYAPLLHSATGTPLRDPRFNRYVVYQAYQADARISGAEASLQYELLPGIAATMGGSMLLGKLKDGSYLPNMPPGRFRLGLRHEGRVWFGSGDIETISAQTRTPDSPEASLTCHITPSTSIDSMSPAEYCNTPAATLVNLSGGVRFALGNMFHTISLSIDNVLNREWRDALWKAKQIAPQPGRNIRLLYRVRY